MNDLVFQVITPMYAGAFAPIIAAVVSAAATTTAAVVQTNAQKRAARSQRELEFAGQNKQLVKADMDKRKAEQKKAAIAQQASQKRTSSKSGLGGNDTLLGGGADTLG